MGTNYLIGILKSKQSPKAMIHLAGQQIWKKNSKQMVMRILLITQLLGVLRVR